MAHTIDLRKKESPPEKPPMPALTTKSAPPAVKQPASLPYHTVHWLAPDAYRRENTKAPYVFAALLGIIAILFAIFQNDLTRPILFGLLAIMVVVHVRRKISTVAVEISPLSIKIGEKNYPHETIKSFWIQYEPEYHMRELSLQLKKWYQPYVKIQIGDQDPVQIRAILVEFIPEEEHEETLVQSLTRRLGL